MGTGNLAREVVDGDRRAPARAITLVESTRTDHRADAEALLAEILPHVGGAVRVAQYRTFGTPELAHAVVEALDGRTAALMANHGAVTHGVDVATAVRATELLEWAATVYWRAHAIGAPRVLDEAQQQAVVDAAVGRRYGKVQPAEQAS